MDKNAFKEYWQEAVSALINEVYRMRGPITTASVNRCWRRELLDYRFFSTGIRHGAAAWLERLEKEEPQTARAISKALNESRLNVGVNATNVSGSLAGAAATAGSGVLLAQQHHASTKAGAAVVAALGVALMVKEGKELCTSTGKKSLCNQLRKEADKQLEKILARV